MSLWKKPVIVKNGSLSGLGTAVAKLLCIHKLYDQMISYDNWWFFWHLLCWFVMISGSEQVYNCAPLVLLRCFILTLFSILLIFEVQLFLLLFSLIIFFLLLCVSRIWWMISAKSSSWSWAIWMEARNMVHEAGAECQSEAVESFLVEHTGV